MKNLYSYLFTSILILFLLSLSSAIAIAETYTVDLDGNGDFTTITDALSSAVNGDVVNVNPGVYRTSIDFAGKNITLRSVDGPKVTTILGSQIYGSVVSFVSGETSDAVLDGFTITNDNPNYYGVGTYIYPDGTRTLGGRFGGGIFINHAAPTINNCIIINNGDPTKFTYGAGIAVLNTAGQTATISNSIIADNNSQYGGGIYIAANDINTANKTHVTMENCQILRNSGDIGAGIYSTSPVLNFTTTIGVTLDLVNCMVNNNRLSRSSSHGAGIAAYNTELTVSSSTIANNLGVGSSNTAGLGIYINNRQLPFLPLTVVNSIIWDNTGIGVASTKQIQVFDTSSINITYSDVGPEITNYVGAATNINADPLFVDPDNSDHHLLRCSPCIDAGTNTNAPFDDIDGDARPIGLVVDMGADESLEDSSVTCLEPQLPVADAGQDQTVNEGTNVTLGGDSTTGDALLWEQIAGSVVLLLGETEANPLFDAPILTGGISSEVLTFQLTATNNDGTEAQDTVNITVVNVNTQPVANAGDDLTVKEGTYVELTGLSSYDVDGDDLSYAWTQVSGPDVNLSSTGSAVTNFTAPLLDGGAGGEALTLEFQLDVFDGFDHAYDTVVVTVEQVNHDPSASAGLDQTVDSGDHVLLDGQGSSDPDNDPLFYYWTQTDGPTVNLDNSQSMAPSFDAPFVTETTTFTFELVVSDGLATSQPDEIIVTVLSPNDPPQCQLAVAEPAFLWPPNHKMEVINIVGITDRDNDNIQITILGVTQDEPVDGLGAGDTAPDAAIQTESVLVRAERSGLGDGRVYKVNFKATDEYGDSCSGSVDVKVLHDRKNGETAIDSGQYFNSMMP